MTNSNTEKVRQWRLKNSERQKSVDAAYYAANREKRKQQNALRKKLYREIDPSWRKKYKKKAKVVFEGMRRRSKERGHPVPEITSTDIDNAMLNGHCEITGIKFEGIRGPFSMSVDRKDSSLGYTKENTRFICWGLNAALNSWGIEPYLKIARAVIERYPNP